MIHLFGTAASQDGWAKIWMSGKNIKSPLAPLWQRGGTKWDFPVFKVPHN